MAWAIWVQKEILAEFRLRDLCWPKKNSVTQRLLTTYYDTILTQYSLRRMQWKKNLGKPNFFFRFWTWSKSSSDTLRKRAVNSSHGHFRPKTFFFCVEPVRFSNFSRTFTSKKRLQRPVGLFSVSECVRDSMALGRTFLQSSEVPWRHHNFFSCIFCLNGWSAF